MEPRDTYATDLIPIGEAAEAVGVSVDTLRRWAADGLIPVVVLPSGHRRFRVSDVAALIEPRSAS